VAGAALAERGGDGVALLVFGAERGNVLLGNLDRGDEVADAVAC
jgi:hypothetical protein